MVVRVVTAGMGMKGKREKVGELTPGALQRYKVRKVGRNLRWKQREVERRKREKQVFERRMRD